MRKRILGSLIVALLLAVTGHAQAPSVTNYQGPFFEAPYVTAGGLLTVNFTAGKVYIGNGSVAVTAGTVTGLTASQATCTRPTFSACNIIYSNSTGTVAKTTALATAQAAGNSILAYVQTSSTAVTTIQYPWQDGGFPAASLSGAFVLSSGSITPSATSAAIQTVGQTFTVTGLTSTDQVALISQPAPTSLCPTVAARATATDTLTLYFSVLTAAACTPAAGTYIVLVIR